MRPHIRPTVEHLLASVRENTLAAMYQDVTDKDDIYSDDLAQAIFDKLAERVGHDEASRRLDLIT